VRTMTRGRHRPATGGAVLAALGLAGACSVGSGATGTGPGPTFARADGAALAIEEPVANVAALVAPPAEGEPWTIVGAVYEPEDRASVATVWTSPDAREWEPTRLDPAVQGTGETMAAAAATGEGLIAVGQAGDGARADAVVWRQVEGEWRPSRPEAMGGDHEQWASDIAVGEGGILVAGGENAWGQVRSRLWFSADGESWESVDGGPGGPLDPAGEDSVRDVAAVGSGFVAVGWRNLDNEQDGAAWYSPDGRSWEPVDAPDLGGDGRQALLTVIEADGGVVAGGYADGAYLQGEPAMWRSPDGRSWSRQAERLPKEDRRQAASDQAVRSLSRSDEGLVAAGGDDWRPHLWTSTDAGASWSELPNPVHGELYADGVALRDAAAAGGLTVAIGEEPTVMLLAGARWEDATGDAFPKGGAVPFAAGVATGDGTAVAAGGRRTAPPSGDERETFVGEIWRQDGGEWGAVDSEPLAYGQVMDLSPFGGGFVAVGVEDFGLAETRGIVSDETPDGLVWISRDGSEWGRIGSVDARIDEAWLETIDNPDPAMAGPIVDLEVEAPPASAAPAGGPGTRSLNAVAPLADGFIAVGSVYDDGDANPIVVVSQDGESFEGEEPPHAGPGIQKYSDVCVAPDGTAVAVGATGANGGFDVAVATRTSEGWTAAASDGFGGIGSQEAYGCAAGEDGFVVVGSDDRSGNLDARIWVSEDGVEWTEVESGLLGGPGDQWASAAVAVPGGRGWLVAGTDAVSDDGDIALWRLRPSGDIERRDRGEPALGGSGRQTASAIAVDEDGTVILAGNDYGRVGLWESRRIDR
jgi:hypothetical protein